MKRIQRISVRFRSFLALLLLTAAVLHGADAAADVVAYSNYQGTAFDTTFHEYIFDTVDGTSWSAYQFTADATGVLSSVTVSLMSIFGYDPSATISLHFDSLDELGAVMKSWNELTIPADAIKNLKLTNADTNIVIEAGQKYWISIQPFMTNSNVNWYWSYDNTHTIFAYDSPSNPLTYYWAHRPATMLVSIYDPPVPPPAPTIGTVTAGSGSGTVDFTAPDNTTAAEIDIYRVTCTSNDGGTSGTQTGATAPLVVDSLTGGATYTCTAAAHNTFGWSPESSASSSFVPDPPAVPDPPQIGLASGVNGFAVVTFTPPVKNGGVTVDSYLVTCTSTDGGSPGTLQGNTWPFVVTGLSIDKTYTCTVAAHNSLGWSSASAASNGFIPSASAAAIFAQQGPKLTGLVGSAQLGTAVAISADGNTAILGGPYYGSRSGTAIVYTRSGGVWTYQYALTTSDHIGAPCLGTSVGLSADGATAIVGGYCDNDYLGAAWIFTRSGSVWTQQDKLVGIGWQLGGRAIQQGSSVALSADGRTALVGGWGDNNAIGATWVFTRGVSAWSQQGDKLVGVGYVSAANQGTSVALSSDGNTALIGGNTDNAGVGAAWVFIRSGSSWTQQGSKLVGTGANGKAFQGASVALSWDGNTAIMGGGLDNGYTGAAWVFTRSSGIWTQQGTKLVGSGSLGKAAQVAVAISANGNTAVVGGPFDDGNAGAVWVFRRCGGVWSQLGNKLVGTDAVLKAYQGSAVALSGDGNTAIAGGYNDSPSGAGWAFVQVGGIRSVIYNANTSTGGSVPVDVNTYPACSSAYVLNNSGGLEKDGYVFAGWDTSPDGSGTRYAAGAVAEIGATDVTLYAQWAYPLSVFIKGSGSGRVGSAPAGIDCYTGSGTGCSSAHVGHLVLLTAYPDWDSTFIAWGGNCGGSDPCSVDMSTERLVYASFAPNLQSKLMPSEALFSRLQDSYYAAAVTNDTTIMAQVYTFVENLVLDRPLAVAFQGGVDSTYNAAPVGVSTLLGSLTISAGSLEVSNLTIR